MPEKIEVEVNPLTIDVNGVAVITIPFDMYNSLMETKGRYDELKDGEEETNNFMEEFKELLVIKGKYEELSEMFDSQQIIINEPVVNENVNPEITHGIQLMNKEVYPDEEECVVNDVEIELEDKED